MGFFGDLWSGIKNVASKVGEAVSGGARKVGEFVQKYAPAVGEVASKVGEIAKAVSPYTSGIPLVGTAVNWIGRGADIVGKVAKSAEAVAPALAKGDVMGAVESGLGEAEKYGYKPSGRVQQAVGFGREARSRGWW